MTLVLIAAIVVPSLLLWFWLRDRSNCVVDNDSSQSKVESFRSVGATDKNMSIVHPQHAVDCCVSPAHAPRTSTPESRGRQVPKIVITDSGTAEDRSSGYDSSEIASSARETRSSQDLSSISAIDNDNESSKEIKSSSLDMSKGSSAGRTSTDAAVVIKTDYKDTLQSFRSKADAMLKKLAEETKQRERAEDWADFLTRELDAHIDARKRSDDRYFKLRRLSTSLTERCRRQQRRIRCLEGQLESAVSSATTASSAASRETISESATVGFEHIEPKLKDGPGREVHTRRVSLKRPVAIVAATSDHLIEDSIDDIITSNSVDLFTSSTDTGDISDRFSSDQTSDDAHDVSDDGGAVRKLTMGNFSKQVVTDVSLEQQQVDAIAAFPKYDFPCDINHNDDATLACRDIISGVDPTTIIATIGISTESSDQSSENEIVMDTEEGGHSRYHDDGSDTIEPIGYATAVDSEYATAVSDPLLNKKEIEPKIDCVSETDAIDEFPIDCASTIHIEIARKEHGLELVTTEKLNDNGGKPITVELVGATSNDDGYVYASGTCEHQFASDDDNEIVSHEQSPVTGSSSACHSGDDICTSSVEMSEEEEEEEKEDVVDEVVVTPHGSSSVSYRESDESDKELTSLLSPNMLDDATACFDEYELVIDNGSLLNSRPDNCELFDDIEDMKSFWEEKYSVKAGVSVANDSSAHRNVTSNDVPSSNDVTDGGNTATKALFWEEKLMPTAHQHHLGASDVNADSESDSGSIQSKTAMWEELLSRPRRRTNSSSDLPSALQLSEEELSSVQKTRSLWREKMTSTPNSQCGSRASPRLLGDGDTAAAAAAAAAVVGSIQQKKQLWEERSTSSLHSGTSSACRRDSVPQTEVDPELLSALSSLCDPAASADVRHVAEHRRSRCSLDGATDDDSSAKAHDEIELLRELASACQHLSDNVLSDSLASVRRTKDLFEPPSVVE